MANEKIGAVQNQPTNVNFLNTHRFRLVVRRAPSLVYFIQEATLPAIAMGNPSQPTPFVDIPRPGDKIQYSDLVCSFPVDEDLTNYKEIANWITGLGFPKQFGEYKDLQDGYGVTSDILLMILDSDHQPMHSVIFKNAFPVSLSEIHFDTKTTDTTIPVVTVTFKYSYWMFDEVNADTATGSEADNIN